MADGFWNRQQPLLHSGGVLKRPRTDHGSTKWNHHCTAKVFVGQIGLYEKDLSTSGQPSGHEMHNYLQHDGEHDGPGAVKDTKTIGSAYDRYLQSSQIPSLNRGEASALGGVGLGGRPFVGGMPGLPTNDHPVIGRHGPVPDLARNGRSTSFEDQLPIDPRSRPGREIAPLPPDASSTLYVEGLPPDSSRREVAHIFRPFVGYKEVRLVSKESRHRGGDPIILCFVDFVNPACAATALNALQGYRVDEHIPESNYLRLQFSRFPGPRSTSGQRGKR